MRVAVISAMVAGGTFNPKRRVRRKLGPAARGRGLSPKRLEIG
jgi:hypothetical protein